MPIYEYKCDKCGNLFEELVTGDRDKKIPCPSCNSPETQKRISAIGGISVKGGGMPSCASGGGCGGMSSCASGGCPHAM
ncbi:MAG: zinc ribbon domain-containing protein [Chitinispirillales bacterium]|jgi:putative FmdB family regulatory protein|nr:zinc ribbon domain-containing protein [Chitinispirillales bacterium]